MRTTTYSSWLRRTARAMHPTRLACLAALTLVTALPASADTIIDEFNGFLSGAPYGWQDMNLDPSGSVSSSGGTLTIQDGRANNPHLLLSTTPVGNISAYMLRVNVASVAANTDLNNNTVHPTVIAAVGGFNGYAIVVQFNTTTKTFSAFINGEKQGLLTFPGSVPAYAGGAINIFIHANMDRLHIFAPDYGYDSGDILYSSALDKDGNPIPFQHLGQLGAGAQFILGTESGGSAVDGTLASVSYDRVELFTFPLFPPLPPTPGNTVAEDFFGGSGGMPSGWIDAGLDSHPDSTAVENGGTVTVTDARNGGPQFIQSTTSIGAITAFTARVDIAARTFISGSRPEPIIALGTIPQPFAPPFAKNLFMVSFNSLTKSFKVQIIGPAMGSYTVPVTMASYAGGPLSFAVHGYPQGFRITSQGFDSGEIPYTNVIATGFTPADLGASPALIIGTESAGDTPDGTLASIAYDRVDLDTTPAAVANHAPTADAGANQSIHAGSTVTLDGSASFDDNTASTLLTYAWSFSSKPAGSLATLNGANIPTPTFVADKTGDYALQLVVTDAQGLSSPADFVTVSSNNLAPTAVASVDFNLAVVGTTVHFSGTGSTDPESDALTYAWSIAAAPAGSTAVLIGATTATPTLKVDKAGTFSVSLTVSDFLGAGTSATIDVVATQPSGDSQVQIMYASDVVEALTAGQVTTKGNQTAFVNFLKQATTLINAGDIAGAISKLQQAIERTDGIALRGSVDGNGASRDWITNPAAQTDVYTLLTTAVAGLQN